MNSFYKHSRGYLGTGIFHLVIAVLLILLSFKTPLPLPQEEGILINFGTDEAGMGLIEPSGSNVPREESQTPASVPDVPEPEPSPGDEEILTQDIEETVALPSTPDPKKVEVERLKQKELQKQKDAEAELEKQRLEKQRLEELERQRIAEEQRKIQEIEDRTKNAFTGGKNLTDNSSTGQGSGSTEGNQGQIGGSTSSDSQTGTGLGDEGVSYNLSGRTPQSLPLPDVNYQVGGKVVVEVTVDRNGNVTKATPGVKGSTTLIENLLKAAKEAALLAKFDRKANAPAFQKGTITYRFMLD